jgi:dienelactone hydrolase
MRSVAGLVVFVCCAGAASASESVTLMAADGVRVFGDYYPAAGAAKATILLFHQAGSNAGEYADIAPRLNKAGYSCLAIDQRSGGERWGRKNRTAAALEHEAEYTDALADLEAALLWARKNHGQTGVVAWGSSYSASLVFLLAARHPGEIAAVLAFSPGEYLGAKTAVRDAAAKVHAPVFVTSAQDAEEVRAAREILAAVPSDKKVQFVPRQGGVHGSSTLLAGENPKGFESVWRAVLAFLSESLP